MLVSAHGNFRLAATREETIRESLWRARVPLSATYIYEERGGKMQAVSALKKVRDVEGQIFVYINRNIQLAPIIGAGVNLYEREDFTTEHISAEGREGGDEFATAVVQLSSEDVIELAKESVCDIFQQMKDVAARGERIIVGYSGGGDSNLLLTALVECGMIGKEQIMPTMVLGIRDWDRQIGIARRRCESLGLPLHVVEEEQAARLAKLDSVSGALTRFHQEFPRTGKEFFGTWLLRRVLSEFARLSGSSYVFIGANREDVLGESLYLLSTGRVPLPFPIREIAGIRFVSPLYKLPKRVIDGAFPSYSVQNYQNRDESDDRGRSIFYYLVYLMQDCLPGIDLTLLEGIQNLCSEENLVWDEELADHVLRGDFQDVKGKWKRVINV